MDNSMLLSLGTPTDEGSFNKYVFCKVYKAVGTTRLFYYTVHVAGI